MLENTIKRIGRRNYYNRTQYPDLIIEIEDAINITRAWIQNYKIYSFIPAFSILLGICIKKLGTLVEELIKAYKQLAGKRKVKESQLTKEQNELRQSTNSMLENIGSYLDNIKGDKTLIGNKMEEALLEAFNNHCAKKIESKVRTNISKRGEKSYIFQCEDKKVYLSLIKDPKKFRKEVLEKLYESEHATGHKESCPGAKYSLIGYRSNPRKVVMESGQEEVIPIRMIKCINCGEKFSVLPSFLPREKHFNINIIGKVLQSIVLFAQSLQGTLQSFKVKSKQTILNWIKWIGFLHPAVILTRAGVKGSGYFQEDEGFEKEPNLRTYSVVMLDPENMLVWHADYVDHVDEETLTGSFESFLERIDFKILGVTKDKWKASTNALKNVVNKLWIGFCHRHFLKKLWEDLVKYQKEKKCSTKEIKRLYKKVKDLLEICRTNGSLKGGLNTLRKEEAFEHELLKERLDDLEKNAVHYTCHKKRKGIKRTTSIVDSFLKIVKRKLRQVESFRDQDCTKLLFKALANVRNFVPFMSGAKNAHKSPFMLAEGETYDLPWIQTMNVHNAFLFTNNAF